MTRIDHQLRASCPPDRLWALLARLDAVATYNPTVRSARILGPQDAGVGAQRACELAPSGRVVERVTVWEPGRALGLEVVESDWPITEMRWVTRVAPVDGGTLLTQELEYSTKYGPFGWLLDRLVMRRKLRTTLDGVLAALIARAESADGPRATK